MVTAAAYFVWLSLLLRADLAASHESLTDGGGQCLTGIVVNQATQLQQLADQLRGLQDKVISLETGLEQCTVNLTALRKAQEAKRDSFRAVLMKQEVTADAPIVFASEFTLGGSHYDPGTGVYTVPISGLYLFGFQLFRANLGKYLVDLYVKGLVRIRSRCFSSTQYTSSCASSSFLHLQKGDTVWMQTSKGGSYFTGAHTFFSGALISPDPY